MTTTTIAPHHPHPTLTPQQARILQYLADGYDRPQICRELFITNSTLRKHMKGIYAKLKCSNEGAAVATALRSGAIR